VIGETDVSGETLADGITDGLTVTLVVVGRTVVVIVVVGEADVPLLLVHPAKAAITTIIIIIVAISIFIKSPPLSLFFAKRLRFINLF
jgi:hypothetical protein